MKEPVLVAVLGVGGVILGAVGGGIVQALLARGERRRAGRAAAVVLYVELHDAEIAVSDLRRLRAWERMITDWDAYAATWALYRDRLSSVLRTPRFAKVAIAFGCLASLKRSHRRDTQNPFPPPGGTPGADSVPVYKRLTHLWLSRKEEVQQPRFDPTEQHLAVYVKAVQRAKRIVLRASFRWWEVRRRKIALSERGPPKLPTP